MTARTIILHSKADLFLLSQALVHLILFKIKPDFDHLAMFALLEWTIWALAISPSMAEATAKPVEWVDLMIATSRFPRFFGAPPHVSRSNPPNVTGLTTGYSAYKLVPPFGKILPVECSTKSGKFSCSGVEYSGFLVPEAVSLLQGRDFKGHDLDGLNFTVDWALNHTYPGSPRKSCVIYFSQNMGERLPIDNTRVEIGLVSRSPKSLEPARLLQPPRLCCLTIDCGRQWPNAWNDTGLTVSNEELLWKRRLLWARAGAGSTDGLPRRVR